MSGIVGLFRRNDDHLEPSELSRMLQAIEHRGSDGRGEWTQDSVGLGHAMLWTTPESLHETLPCSIGGLSITADARIDNREQLWTAIGKSGAPPENVPDSQIILHAYQKWGEACVEHLVGDFAFAIWDAQKQTLFCARDHFGVKPLYYFLSKSTFAFASEIKAILTLTEVARDLDDSKIFDFLTPAFDDVANTFYKQIKRLPAAHCISITPNETKLWRYWELDPKREIKLGSNEEYAERFRELFVQAVSRRLRSAYPVGSMLSGGLDSSAIACMAQVIMSKSGSANLQSYSAIFDDVPESDERAYIQAALSAHEMQPHYVHGDKLSPWHELNRVLWQQDEALFAFNHFLNWSIYARAHENGARIILDGFDGDTTVSHGDGYLRELAARGKVLPLFRESRALAKRVKIGWHRIFWNHMWNYRLRSGIRRRRLLRLVLKAIPNRSNQGSAANPENANIVNPEFASRVSEYRENGGSRSTPRSERERHHELLTWGVMPYMLEIMDRSASAFGVEPRYPFWDKDLVEFCLALPAEQKIRNGVGRLIMRRGLEGILPKAIQWREDKSNLGYNFKHCLHKYEKERLEDVIANRSKVVEDYVNLDELRAAYQRYVSRVASDDDIMALWRAASLALWLDFVCAGTS